MGFRAGISGGWDAPEKPASPLRRNTGSILIRELFITMLDIIKERFPQLLELIPIKLKRTLPIKVSTAIVLTFGRFARADIVGLLRRAEVYLL